MKIYSKYLLATILLIGFYGCEEDVSSEPDSFESIINSNSKKDNVIYYVTTDNRPLEVDESCFNAPIFKHEYYKDKDYGEIVFMADVTTIGDSAFRVCETLEQIIIPDSAIEIGDFAFNYCTNLTSIEIPDSVASIGELAFSQCTSLTSVTIGGGVTEIAELAFKSCTSLTSFYGKYASEDGRCLIIDGTLRFFAPAGLTKYTIPNNVASIGEWAFSNYTLLTSVTIPDSVTSIGKYAFLDCTSLTSVTIPDSVTSIGGSAFSRCTSLVGVYCETTIPPTGDYDMFYNNAAGRKIYVPIDSVTKYKSATYWKNYAEDIVAYDFEKGQIVELPPNNEIWYTSVDNAVVMPYDTTVFSATLVSNTYENGKGVITFDGDLTWIGRAAFYYRINLTSITLPDSVTSIGKQAFYGCSNLLSITIPKSVTSIGDYAFSDCSSLTSVTFPDSVTSIGTGAFKQCTSLTSITIPDSITSVGNSVFFGCSALRNITIPDNITSIEYQAFRDCTSLTSVTIGDGVTEIAGLAFNGCSRLENITIPDNVTSIGAHSFRFCNSLASSYCKAATPPTAVLTDYEWCAFDNNASNRKIYVPFESVEAYKTANGWKNFADDIVGFNF